MELQPINKEDIQIIKNNIDNISLLYDELNCNKIYKIYEKQQEIDELLNKYNLHILINQNDSQKSAKAKIIDYLNECEKVSEIFNIVEKYNWSLEDTEKYFEIIKSYFKNIINKKSETLEWQIKKLPSRKFNELIK